MERIIIRNIVRTSVDGSGKVLELCIAFVKAASLIGSGFKCMGMYSKHVVVLMQKYFGLIGDKAIVSSNKLVALSFQLCQLGQATAVCLGG